MSLVGCALASAPAPVQDTPEVAAAKAHFFAQYNARAHLAAHAPDIDVNYVDNYHDAVIPHAGKYVTPVTYGYPAHYPYGIYPYAASLYPYGFGYHPYLVAKPAEADEAVEEADRKKRSVHYYRGHHGKHYGHGYRRYGHHH